MPDFNSPLIHLEKFITVRGGGCRPHINHPHINRPLFNRPLFNRPLFNQPLFNRGDTVTYFLVAVRRDRKDLHVAVRGDSKDIYIVYVRSMGFYRYVFTRGRSGG